MQRNTAVKRARNATSSSSFSSGRRMAIRRTRLNPMMRALVTMLTAGMAVGVAGSAQAQRAFSPAWMAQKNLAQDMATATGRLPNGQLASTVTNPLAQQQKANAQLQNSIGNLNLAARGIAAQQAAQAAARAAALAAGGSAPDGLGEGGLKVDTNSLTAGWANAQAPVQTDADGKTNVAIRQTADKAILNWETFNVGQNTTLEFQQQAEWSVLNRVNDPQSRPSRIQGQIKADGTVLVVNRNGIVFGGSSQVDTRNLAASALNMTDGQFRKGLYSDAQGNAYIPSFANDLATTASTFSHSAAQGDVVVEAGARIATRKPSSVTEGGGYVLLMGGEVHNRGAIDTPSGQTVLAAGDAFVIRKGMGTDQNQNSTTRGNEISALTAAGSSAGLVVNKGLIQAATGDVTLTGRMVRQDGVVVATTSVHTRGTIHLKAGTAEGALAALGADSTTAVLLDETASTALDVQRETLIKDSGGQGASSRRDQSLIHITGGDAIFEGRSLTLATGGQVMVDAIRRSDVADGARIDVSGAVGVRVAMEANNVLINVQGNEQRDAPVNRDEGGLRNSNIWIDRRVLVRVPAGTNGYETDRWYTAGGLLEVGGYLGIAGHGIGEWSAQGGTVQFTGQQLHAHAGSEINLAGGTLDVQTGYVAQTFLKGADGLLYNASTAPGDLRYTGIYKGFETQHARWGDTAKESFYSPLIAAQKRLENGYVVGRDAGRLVVATEAAVLQGQIDTSTFQGERQTRLRDTAMDGYQQAQTAVARGAQLVIGAQIPVYDKDSGHLRQAAGAVVDDISFGDAAGEALEAGTIAIDAAWFNARRFGELEAYAFGGIRVDKALSVATGGTIALHASDVRVDADLSARGGNIRLGDMVVLHTPSGDPWRDMPIGNVGSQGYERQVVVGNDVTLDARGEWSNLLPDRASADGLSFIDGGNVALRSSGSVTLREGSLIDVSSGASMDRKGRIVGGKGGNVTLATGLSEGAGVLVLDGSIRGYGVKGGGALNIEHGTLVSIGGDLPQAVEKLAAGEVSDLPLRLADDVVLQPGQVIPVSFSVVVTHVRAGQPMPVAIRPSVSSTSPVVTQAPWLLPTTVAPATGPYQYAGTVLPAGTELHIISDLPAGYVIPADVFPNGLFIPPQTFSYTAGNVTAKALIVPRGTRLPAGTSWQQDVAVQSFLALDAQLFRSGFKNYNIKGRDGLTLVDGARVDVAMPVLLADYDAARDLASGADLAGAFSAVLPALQQDQPARGQTTLRQGASLVLSAGDQQALGDLLLGKGSSLNVDPGQSIRLSGNGQITLEGSVVAHGGRISVLAGATGTGASLNMPSGTPNARSIWIGDGAVLDVSGQAFVGIDDRGRRFGQVLDGGTIEIGGAHGLGASALGAVNGFMVVRPDARLDASGAAAVLDLPGLGETLLASDGGTISLSATNGLFIDGQLRAASGGANASGGTLALALETPVYGAVERFSFKGLAVDDAVRVARELVIEQVYGGSGLAAGVQVGQMDPSLAYGKARYGIDAIHAGGFDTASLYVNGLLSFDGNIDLHMGQALYLTASALGLSTAAARDSQVSLSAPYLRLSGSSARQSDNTLMPNPVFGSRNTTSRNGTLGVPLVADGSGLTISAGLVDIVGEIGMGARGEIILNAPAPLRVERDAFDNVRIESRGDLRLRDVAFYSPGDTTLAAAQIYGSGKVGAGMRSTLDQWGNLALNYDPQRALNIEGTAATLPAMPYSVFGAIAFGAATVNQGGVLRAPLGSITFGVDAVTPHLVNLLPGSLTSVSANGLVMPYGGTVDGLVYNYNGVDVAYQGIGGEPRIDFNAHAVDAQPGAVLDLSGGGKLVGAAFLQGRGGSTDARLNPLVQVRSDGSGFTLPGLATNPVYALVPGAQAGYAPLGAEKGAGDPALGRQITIGDGVPGLPAGTYTLLPSTYALLPGAFRVELNGLAASSTAFGATRIMRNGSWSTAVRLGTANTGAVDVFSTQAVLTPADVLRSYSQYNETGYADFALQQAAREGVPAPLLERDAKALNLLLAPPGTAPGTFGRTALTFDAIVLGTPAEGGKGTVTRLRNASRYEILADGQAPTEGFDGVSVHAGELNAIGGARLEIGGMLTGTYSDANTGSVQNANVIRVTSSGTSDIVLRAGSLLQAAGVFLMTGRVNGGIVLEQGAGISTLDGGASAYDSTLGYTYQPGRTSVLAVSNGQLNLLAPSAPDTEGNGAGAIEIGICANTQGCSGETRLYSQGTIATATDNRFVLGDTVRYGTRNLVLALGGVNIGSSQSLADAAVRGALPAGLTLNQDVLDRLLLGDTSTGAPALEALLLTARESVNFFGDVTLSTYDASGKSALQRLVLGTPAIYGYGDAASVGRIHTDTLVWTGARTAPGSIVTGGPGTGSGQLVVDAREIVFGFGPQTQPDTVREHDRIALGFAGVQLNASDRVTATHKGTFAVYQTQGAWNDDAKVFERSGGTLAIRTPLLTGAAGSVNRITAGGDIRVGGSGAASPDMAALAGALGAEIALDSRSGSLLLDTTVLLPSGKLTLAAAGDVNLADGAHLDLAGRKIDFFDVSKYSWGGDVVLESRGSDVLLAASSRIDLSAVNNRAGKLGAFAMLGAVDLAGQILGGSSGYYDAGGTEVPFAAGRIDVRGQSIAGFADLNTRLTSGGVTGGRSFQLRQGDLVIGDEVRAHEVNVSVDNGHLSVNGTIDAGGKQAGSIRLAARSGVTLAGTAVLDASASVLRRDSYGQAIEAPNRAVIEIDSGTGTLAIASGARMDLRVAGSAANYGTVALNAPRVGTNDIAISVPGSVVVDGAKSIQVNAFITDKSAAPGLETTTDGKSYQVIDQAYLDRLHEQSRIFIDAALDNRALMTGKLAGLRAYGGQFHLRPGVEVVADLAVNPDGNLHVDGDLDLSGHRYASVNPFTQKTGVYGSGEAGSLVLRAQGDLEVFGSISDGFDGSRLLAGGFDDKGWFLTAGRQLFASDVVVPHGGLVTLAAGTVFNAGKVLNYELPIAAMQMAAGTLLPAAATLASPLALAKGTVLSADVRDASGALLYAAGTVLAEAVTLPQDTRLSAGLRLPVGARIGAMTWPAGVALPHMPIGNFVVLAADVALRKGALIPSDTDVKLPGDAFSVDLRPKDVQGNQGRQWAVAPMLPGGSQSWDLTLVAGADTSAADRLTVLRNAASSLRFSDAHYGQGGGLVVVPGTGSPATYNWGDLSQFEQLVLDFFGEYVLSFTPVSGEAFTPAEIDEMTMWGFFSGDAGMLNDYGYGALVDLDKPAVDPDKVFLASARPREQLSSVVRTGTGDLRLVSGRDISTSSLYGIYTAGTPSASLAAPGTADPYNLPRSLAPDGSVLNDLGQPFEALVDGGSQSFYQAWYPEAGGNLLLRAQGNVGGDSLGLNGGVLRQESAGIAASRLTPSSSAGNWLWRQGTGSVQTGADGAPTAWWINFGTYVRPGDTTDYYDGFVGMPRQVAFTGFGTLGGGNLVLESGANAGMLQFRGDHGGYYLARSSGLNLAVGGTGRVTPQGALVLTGGGDMDIRIGGGLNADPANNSFTGSNFDPVANTYPARDRHMTDINGTFTNLRGALRLEAGAVGSIELKYGALDPKDSRPNEVFSAGRATSSGGPVLLLGDSTARLDARGDLVLGSAADPGRVSQLHGGTPFKAEGASFDGGGYSWYSLWTPSTAVDLMAAGGNLTPTLNPVDFSTQGDGQATDVSNVYPSVLRAAAASGSIYYGHPLANSKGVVLAPSPVGTQFAAAGSGQLELLAAGSLYAASSNFSASGADPAALPNPLNPGFVGLGEMTWYGRRFIHNVSVDAIAPSVLLGGLNGNISDTGGAYALFSFTPPTASGHVYAGQEPARYYAVTGDLVGLRLGTIIYRGSQVGESAATSTWYDGGGAVAIRAGRDIVNSGSALGSYDGLTGSYRSGSFGWYGQENRADLGAPQRPDPALIASGRGNLIVHTSADDVSVVQAGRDVRYSSFYVAGPGLLDISAGRDVYLADKGELRSLGPVANVTSGDRSSGAGIAVAAGMGQHGADWAAFAARYLDAANLAETGRPLADQPGKVVRSYGGSITLAQWLAREFGYTGGDAGADAFLASQQAALDQTRANALAAGGTASNRNLAREYKLEGQLHLVNWLTQRFGSANGRGLHFDAATMDARAFFTALPPAQQSAFLRNVYYAELRAAGREYNDVDGPREGSYLRGREAIATLLPAVDAQGSAQTYQGDLTMFSSALYYDQFVIEGAPDRRPKPGKTYVREDEWVAMGRPGYDVPFYKVNDAGIHTDFGGDISLMVPGGRALVGVDGGFMPGAGSGVLTQGEGDINVYALGSLLLGQSRIFTTFGGNILAWSAEGDINAGRGAKTTVVYTPARRTYDDAGNVALSPTTPNTGAGIATLNPIPEIPPGDIDLIAPLGTIDAGEAGIRVSGNVNLAALHVVNAENIQVQGKSVGIPVVAAVNVGALANASAAASQAAVAAQDVMQRERAAARESLPSIFTVRVLGFGNEAPSVPQGRESDAREKVSYNPDGVVQVLGAGTLTAAQQQALTPGERRGLVR